MKVMETQGYGIHASGTGKYLAVSSNHGCYLIDIAAAELVGKIDSNKLRLISPDLFFSPDGTRLAIQFGKSLAIWNLPTAKMELEVEHPKTMGQVFGWIGDDYLLTGLGGLLDVRPETGTGQSVWDYYISSLVGSTVPGGLVAMTKTTDITFLTLPVPHQSGLIGTAKSMLGKRTVVKNGAWKE